MATSTIRALVIDDSALYRKFVSSVLEDIPEVEVVGTATDGRIGLRKIQELQPDFITLDLEMPELDGLGLLEALTDLGLELPTIMISSMTATGAESTNRALQLGAFDFVLKPQGKGPEESREQLKQDLAPKISASLASLRTRKDSTKRVQTNSDSTPPSATKRFASNVNPGGLPPQVVSLGVSTGGPVALNQVIPRLPADFPCPMLIVQHMPPLFTASLAKDLDRASAVKVVEAVSGMQPQPGQVYIAPGGSQMRVVLRGRARVIEITDDPPERSCRPSVDYLFRSVAKAYGDRVLGVVLTGMGDDGTIGCELLKRNGAKILTQDEESCVVYGMPRSVVEAGLSDKVAPLNAIADCLVDAVGVGTTAW